MKVQEIVYKKYVYRLYLNKALLKEDKHKK